MGNATTIRLPDSALRDRLNVLVAQERKKRGGKYTQVMWIEEQIIKEETNHV